MTKNGIWKPNNMIPPWHTLREIQKSKFVGSMYIWMMIVPIAAKTLEKLSDKLDFNLFGAQISIVPSLPFSWKLFFFSALFLSIANTIVLAICPSIIKDHLSFTSFRGDGKIGIDIEVYAHQIGMEFKTQQTFGSTQELYTRLNEEYLSSEFSRVRQTANRSRQTGRFWALLFYIIGGGCFTIVVAMNVWWVGKYIYCHGF